MPPMAKDREKCRLLRPIKIPSTTHHAEGNSMASLTHMVVRKGIPNPLITEELLKILMDQIPPIPTRSPYQFSSRNGRATNCIYIPIEIITDVSLQVSIIPLTIKLRYIPSGYNSYLSILFNRMTGSLNIYLNIH